MAPISGVFLMKPARPGRASGDLFRERLDAIIDMRHPLVRLAGLMPWADFDESFGQVLQAARPAGQADASHGRAALSQAHL